MHILRSYPTTVLSLISIGLSIREELDLQDIWTDGQTDRHSDSYIHQILVWVSYNKLIHNKTSSINELLGAE